MVFHSVGSFMLLQKTYLRALVIPLRTTEWFFTSVGSFMLLQKTYLRALVIPLQTTEWFFTSVASLLFDQCDFEFSTSSTIIVEA